MYALYVIYISTEKSQQDLQLIIWIAHESLACEATYLIDAVSFQGTRSGRSSFGSYTF